MRLGSLFLYYFQKCYFHFIMFLEKDCFSYFIQKLLTYYQSKAEAVTILQEENKKLHLQVNKSVDLYPKTGEGFPSEKKVFTFTSVRNSLYD